MGGGDQNQGTSVDEIVKSLEPEKKEIAEKLRGLIKKTLPKVMETVKWGNITYLLDDRKIAWILFYIDHVDLGFFAGAKLHSKLLEGTGKGLRHVKIRIKMTWTNWSLPAC